MKRITIKTIAFKDDSDDIVVRNKPLYFNIDDTDVYSMDPDEREALSNNMDDMQTFTKMLDGEDKPDDELIKELEETATSLIRRILILGYGERRGNEFVKTKTITKEFAESADLDKAVDVTFASLIESAGDEAKSEEGVSEYLAGFFSFDIEKMAAEIDKK